jgi:quinol monooxygenase YgiN
MCRSIDAVPKVSETMQVRILIFECSSGQGADLLGELEAGLFGDRLAREGCQTSIAYVDVAEPDSIVLFEEWDSRAHIERWIAARKVAGLHDAFVNTVTPMLASPYQVRYLEPTSA